MLTDLITALVKKPVGVLLEGAQVSLHEVLATTCVGLGHVVGMLGIVVLVVWQGRRGEHR